MSHYNSVILVGFASRYNFGTTASGVKYAEFRMLVVDRFTQKETKNYFNIVCYSGIADLVERFQEDNKHILVDGRISPQSDEYGNQWIEIIATQVKFL